MKSAMSPAAISTASANRPTCQRGACRRSPSCSASVPPRRRVAPVPAARKSAGWRPASSWRRNRPVPIRPARFPPFRGKRRRCRRAQISRPHRPVRTRHDRGSCNISSARKRQAMPTMSRPIPDAGTRIDQVEAAAKALSNTGTTKNSARDDARLALARAKVVGLSSNPARPSSTPTPTRTSRCAGALCPHHHGLQVGCRASPPFRSWPIWPPRQPSNPFFQELLGQMYLETGNAAKGAARRSPSGPSSWRPMSR